MQVVATGNQAKNLKIKQSQKLSRAELEKSESWTRPNRPNWIGLRLNFQKNKLLNFLKLTPEIAERIFFANPSASWIMRFHEFRGWRVLYCGGRESADDPMGKMLKDWACPEGCTCYDEILARTCPLHTCPK